MIENEMDAIKLLGYSFGNQFISKIIPQKCV